MATPLEIRAIEVLPEEFTNRPPEGFNSVAVYTRLISEGWTVPDYALDDLWTKLEVFDYIAGTQVLGDNEAAEKQHGNWYIQRLHPDILEAPNHPEL